MSFNVQLIRLIKYDLSWVIVDDVKTRRIKVLTEIQSSKFDNIMTSDIIIFQEFQITQLLGKSDHVGLISKWAIADNKEYITNEKNS